MHAGPDGEGRLRQCGVSLRAVNLVRGYGAREIQGYTGQYPGFSVRKQVGATVL